jgi:hypothetical protein
MFKSKMNVDIHGPRSLLRFRHLAEPPCSARDWDRIRITWGNPQSGCSEICSYLTLTLTSESVYGSQFFHCKLLQVLMS